MYVARDKNKSLWLFIDKPKRSQNNDWWRTSSQDDECLEINGDLFPELRWEDEPLEVEFVRKEDKR